jgi:hypothetical protein
MPSKKVPASCYSAIVGGAWAVNDRGIQESSDSRPVDTAQSGQGGETRGNFNGDVNISFW